MFPVAVAQSSSDGVAICYILPVLRMMPWGQWVEASTTLCFKEVCQVAVAVGHQSMWPWAKSAVYDGLVV